MVFTSAVSLIILCSYHNVWNRNDCHVAGSFLQFTILQLLFCISLAAPAASKSQSTNKDNPCRGAEESS